MPVSTLMAIIHTLSSSIMCDPWLGDHKEKNTSETNQKGIEETFIRPVIPLLLWSGSQSVS